MSCPSRNFLDITVHTARCGDCNARNTSILKRCPRCGHQQCVPCNQMRSGAHGMHLLGLMDLSISREPGRKSSAVSTKKKSGSSSIEAGSRSGIGGPSRQRPTTSSSRKRTASRSQEEQTVKRKKRLVRESKRKGDSNGPVGRPKGDTSRPPTSTGSASSSPGLFVPAHTPPNGHVQAESLRWSRRSANHQRSPSRLLSPGPPTPISAQRRALRPDMTPHRDESPFRGRDINDDWSFPDEHEVEREDTQQLHAHHDGVVNGNVRQHDGDTQYLPARPNGLTNSEVNGQRLTNGHGSAANTNGLINGLGDAVNRNGPLPSIEIYEDSPDPSPSVRPAAPPNSPLILELDASQRQRRDTTASTTIEEPALPSTFQRRHRALHSQEVIGNSGFLETVSEDDEASPSPSPRVGRPLQPQSPRSVATSPYTPSTLLSRGRNRTNAPTPGNEENITPQHSPEIEPSSPDTQIAAPSIQSPTQYTVARPWQTSQDQQVQQSWAQHFGQPDNLSLMERASGYRPEPSNPPTTESHTPRTTPPPPPPPPHTNGITRSETTESQPGSPDHSPGAYNHRATRSGRYAPRQLDGTMDSPPSATGSTRASPREVSGARPGTYEQIEEELDKLPVSEFQRRQPRPALPPFVGLDMLKPSARSAVLEYRAAYERARQKEMGDFDTWSAGEVKKAAEMRMEEQRRRRRRRRDHGHSQSHPPNAPPDNSLGAHSGTFVAPKTGIAYSAVRDTPRPGRKVSVNSKLQIAKLIQHLPGEEWDWETYQAVHGAIYLDDQLPHEQRRLSAEEREDAEEILMDLIPDMLPQTDKEGRETVTVTETENAEED